jgi:hypothetical protein
MQGRWPVISRAMLSSGDMLNRYRRFASGSDLEEVIWPASEIEALSKSASKPLMPALSLEADPAGRRARPRAAPCPS